MTKFTLGLVFSLIPLAWEGPIASGGPPAPPTNPIAVDRLNDNGTAIILTWELSPDDASDAVTRTVLEYEILRSDEADGKFAVIDKKPYGITKFIDRNCDRNTSYFYRIVAVDLEGEKSQPAATTDPAISRRQWFDQSRLWFGVILIILNGSVLVYIQIARSGRELKIRKIAGLEAVDEAVGRATEMGRSCLFIPGIQDMNDIQTVAGITILARVARTAAEYDAKIEVPTSRSLVMTAARETVQAAFLAAGRPDAYNEDLIYYITDEQFGYVAAVGGKMLREKPAACFYMGAFFAESLILAETGHEVGAIQVAGTAMPSQLPFFVAACDYTLIGEEFFAASAYLSGEPVQLGSLKGQDVGKFIVGMFLVCGCISATLCELWPQSEKFEQVFDFLIKTVLT